MRCLMIALRIELEVAPYNGSWIPIRSTNDKSIDAALLANKEIFRGVGKLDGIQIKLNIET